MVSRPEFLRRRIAYYRRRLAEGLEASLAQEYLQQIMNDEAELAHLEEGNERRD